MNDHASPTAPATISGRLVVIAIFLFAGCATAFLAFYWNKHIEPFMPLQLAIEKEWKGSSPRVEGGQRKMSKKTPKILRVTLRVPFDPGSEQNEQLAWERVHAIANIARDHVTLSDYELLTVNFYQENPGKVLKRRTIEALIADLLAANKPFMSLQLAIEKKWEGSSPRVEGGQRKMPGKTRKILRVTLRVPFDPNSEQSEQLTRERLNAIADIARDHVTLSDYELLTVNFYQEAGTVLKRKTIEARIADLPLVVPDDGSQPAG